MASIRQHRDRLLIDYRDDGVRQRVYTKLEDNQANRAKLQRVADHVDAALSSGNSVKAVLELAGLVQTLPESRQAAVGESRACGGVSCRKAEALFGNPSAQRARCRACWPGRFDVGVEQCRHRDAQAHIHTLIRTLPAPLKRLSIQ